jgi:hypothetical protein
MFQYHGHVFDQGHVFVSRPCFSIKLLVHFTVYYLFLGVQMALCIYVYVSLCFIISIHSKNIHPKITSSFCRCLCFMSCTFNMCHIFIDCTSSMFCIPGLFMSSDFFVLFFAD